MTHLNTFSPRFNGTVIVGTRSQTAANGSSDLSNSPRLQRMLAPDSYTDNHGRFRAITHTSNYSEDSQLLQSAKSEGHRAFYLPHNLYPNDLHLLLESLSTIRALEEAAAVTNPDQIERRETAANGLYDYAIQNAKHQADLLKRIGDLAAPKTS